MQELATSRLLNIVVSLLGGTSWCSTRPGFDQLSSQNPTRIRGNIQKQGRLSSGVGVVCKLVCQAESAFKDDCHSYHPLLLQVDQSKRDEESPAPKSQEEKPQEFKFLGPIEKSTRYAPAYCVNHKYSTQSCSFNPIMQGSHTSLDHNKHTQQ